MFDYLKLLYITECIYVSTCSACQSISGRTPSMTIYEFSWEVSSTSPVLDVQTLGTERSDFFFTVQGTEQCHQCLPVAARYNCMVCYY